MEKKLFLLFLLAISFILPSHAVLKENGLDTTLVMLRSELTQYHIQLEQQSKAMKADRKAMFMELFTILNQANQNSIMLYSQKDGYTFDMAYACHEATEQFHSFKNKAKPFRKALDEVNIQVARYDSLIQSLTTMPTMYLSSNSNINRNVCLTLAVNIRRQLVENQKELNDYIRFYRFAEQRLQGLNDYANKRYSEIQNNIFKNNGDNFFSILHHLSHNVKETKMSIVDKYRPSKHFMSQWDVRYIMFLFSLIIFYGFISIALNFLVIRIIVTKLMKKGLFAKIKDQFMAKRPCIMMAMTAITFAIILGVIRATVQQNFLIMASGLLVEYAWLLGVILISLLLRVDGNQIKSAFRIYTPMIVMGFIVIAFRIILIPNNMVDLIFPPIILICALWQWSVITRHNKNVPKSDIAYTWVTLLVFATSVISSWIGYTLLSVQILIWWIMQLTCILTITCIASWLKGIAKARHYENKTIQEIWFHDLILHLVLPVCSVISIIGSIYWATDVFNLSDTVWSIFNLHFVNSEQISFSLFNLCLVIILYFTFSYLNNTVIAFIKLRLERIDPTTAASRYMMSKNVLQFFVWGIWLLISISICHISYTWFVVISGGLSTGIGFAMKDILENIYYGISLMAGRIKIGDYIVCEGVRGRVSSINYTSTMVEAIDGSVMAFQNSQLFTKNYKNMTKNHGYELDSMEVGVAYGTNIEKTKKLLVEEIMKLDCIYQEKGVKVMLKSFDESCITLKILVWVNVLTQSADDSKIMETIYKTFTDNNIEMPFPQREITIRKGQKPVSFVDPSDKEDEYIKKADDTSEEDERSGIEDE